MAMLQRFLPEESLSCAPAPSAARRPAALQHCPTEIVEQALGYLDALSLHFAARTCRKLYLAAQKPQALQCTFNAWAPCCPSPKLSWHAQHSALSRLQARWMLGVPGPHSTSAVPSPAGHPLAHIPMRFAGRYVVLCDSAGACMVAACGDLGWRMTDDAFVDLVDAQGRADGTLVTQSKTHLRLHDVSLQRCVLRAETIALSREESRMAQHPCAPYLAIHTQTQIDVYRLPSFVHLHCIDTTCEAVGIDAAGTCVVSYDSAGYLRAFAIKTAQLLWEVAVARDAEMTMLDAVVVLHTAQETTLYNAHDGRVHGSFCPPHPLARYHSAPSLNHLCVSFVGAPGSQRVKSCTVQMQTGEVLGLVRAHEGVALAVSADGAWLATQAREKVTFTSMRPARGLLRHYG